MSATEDTKEGRNAPHHRQFRTRRCDALFRLPLLSDRPLGRVHRTTVFRWIATGKLATLKVADRRVITQEEIDKARAEKTESEVLA